MDACNSISTLDFKYEARMPESLKSQGVLLKGDEADRFIHAARNYLYRLDRELGERIGFYTRELAKRMRTIQLEKMLLEQFEKELAVLEKSVTNKKMELEKILSTRQ